MKDLHLAVIAEYFHAMKDGSKPFEFRSVNDHWIKRIRGRKYRRLIITLGYPKRDDLDKRLDLPWRGYEERTITHKHFGGKPVRVFALRIKTRSRNQEKSLETSPDLV